MNEISKSDCSKKTDENELECDQKMDEIIYQLKILTLNTILDVLEKLNEKNVDQMTWQRTITYI
jgi:hypothetical protein